MPRPSLALPRSHPLSSLLLFSCLFRGMWLAGCVRRADSKSLTHSLSKFPFFYLALHTSSSFMPNGVCIHHTRTHILFDPTVSAESISPLPFSVSSQASPCSDLFRCVVASRVCVHLRALPSKIQTFQGSQQYNMAALL